MRIVRLDRDFSTGCVVIRAHAQKYMTEPRVPTSAQTPIRDGCTQRRFFADDFFADDFLADDFFAGVLRFAGAAGLADVPATWAVATAAATSSRPHPSSGVQVVCPVSFLAVFARMSRTLLALKAGFALSINAAAPATAGVADDVPLNVFVNSPGSYPAAPA